jgi:hypothetical protein
MIKNQKSIENDETIVKKIGLDKHNSQILNTETKTKRRTPTENRRLTMVFRNGKQRMLHP